jgi:hypothetical protein
VRRRVVKEWNAGKSPESLVAKSGLE